MRSASFPAKKEPGVFFFFEQSGFSLRNRTELKKFIQSLFRREHKRLAFVNYIFVSERRLLDINRQFLQHDFYTDIITFDLSEGPLIQAEIYISPTRVKENAEKLRVSFKSEIHRVIFHGALHLCGYDDKTKDMSGKMRDMEDRYLGIYMG